MKCNAPKLKTRQRKSIYLCSVKKQKEFYKKQLSFKTITNGNLRDQV